MTAPNVGYASELPRTADFVTIGCAATAFFSARAWPRQRRFATEAICRAPAGVVAMIGGAATVA